MIPRNICAVFKASGIFRFNTDIFTDLDFAPSEVTDREFEVRNEENRTNVPIIYDDNEILRTPSPPVEILCPDLNKSLPHDENCAQKSDKTRSPSPSILELSCSI
ncbi:hypothetical protein HHI36_008126 [Cryptolaemus montrouzieri]|uniref:Uncharacterized protein n=1 Tax=Cryptolaemus montrouzieri TaxID=559131 RepID=A0ABD2MRL1_9CUCU